MAEQDDRNSKRKKQADGKRDKHLNPGQTIPSLTICGTCQKVVKDLGLGSIEELGFVALA
jgi:hypothetical protein